MTKTLLAFCLRPRLPVSASFRQCTAFLARDHNRLRCSAGSHIWIFYASAGFSACDTNGNVSISIDEGCVQILDGPALTCGRMTDIPGLTVRRPTGQPTNVTFTNNLDATTGEMTVHNHGNHSPQIIMGNQNRCLSRQEDRARTDRWVGSGSESAREDAVLP